MTSGDYAKTRDRIQNRLKTAPVSDRLNEETLWLAFRAGRIATGLGSRLPIDARCLSRSLAVWWLLRDDGLPAQLRIGVSLAGGFGAHAWVELSGAPLTDARDALSHFSVIEETGA